MDRPLRVQIIAEEDFIRTFEESAKGDAIDVERQDIQNIDQKYVGGGVLEIGALIVTFQALAALAEKIVDVWAKTRRPIKVTVATPKGSVTVEGDAGKSVDEVLERLNAVVA